jgi:hypothetical protein
VALRNGEVQQGWTSGNLISGRMRVFQQSEGQSNLNGEEMNVIDIILLIDYLHLMLFEDSTTPVDVVENGSN